MKTTGARFNGVDAILLVGVGFAIHPLAENLVRLNLVGIALCLLYLTIAYRRIVPRLASLSEIHPE